MVEDPAFGTKLVARGTHKGHLQIPQSILLILKNFLTLLYRIVHNREDGGLC